MSAWLAEHWVEVVGFGTGALCVFLAARRNIWTFPVGIANNLVFLVLFSGAALYADAGLQLVYLALGVQGWVLWARGRRSQGASAGAGRADAGDAGAGAGGADARGGDARGADARGAGFVRRTPVRAVLPLAIGFVALTALLVWVLASFTDSTTELPDAATTAGSLVAQLMLNRRWLGTWFVWIAVDVAYVGLYAAKGLWITAVLYAFFIGLCVDGYRSWRRRGLADAVAAQPGGVVARAG